LIPLLPIAIALSAIKMRMPVRTSAAGSSANDITAGLADVSRIRQQDPPRIEWREWM
jgi:hypothetical protein